MGGYRGCDLAPLVISEDNDSMVTPAECKTPAATYIGGGEQPVLSDEAPKTHDLLRKENFLNYLEPPTPGTERVDSCVSMRVQSLEVKAARSFLTSRSNAPRLFRGSRTTELNPA
jgi:hypothetical protein